MKTVSAVLFLFITSAFIAPAEITTTEERDIARWIIRKGGQVMVTGVPQPVGDPFQLPAGDFRIVMVDMHGTITEPKELEPLSKLTHVRELYVPARVWSPVSDVKAPFADESFQYYQGMKELEKFHAGLTTLAWLDIGDEGVKRMTPLTQLKDLRLNNTTIKDPKCFEGLINLESLDLGDAYVLDHSLVPLAKMKNLRRLNLLGTLVTDEGLKHISGLTELEDLDLYGVKVTDWEQMRNLILARPSQSVNIDVKRGSERKTFTLTPVIREGHAMIGVQPVYKTVPIGFKDAVVRSVEGPAIVVGALVSGLGRLVTGKEKPQLTGPVGIVKEEHEVRRPDRVVTPS